MKNEERLLEITTIVDSQNESIRKMCVIDARWLIKRVGVLQFIIDEWIGIEAHVQDILDSELR